MSREQSNKIPISQKKDEDNKDTPDEHYLSYSYRNRPMESFLEQIISSNPTAKAASNSKQKKKDLADDNSDEIFQMEEEPSFHSNQASGKSY